MRPGASTEAPAPDTRMNGAGGVGAVAELMGRLRWNVVFDPPREGAANMAADNALAKVAGPGDGWLRLYRWARPTLSLGRNEPAEYDFERARRLGVGVVRRPTGGRGVLHDAELTYAVVVPLARAGRLRAVYTVVQQGLAAGLCALGAEARLATPATPGAPRAGACFDMTAGGEVVAGGRKLTGSAQARIGPVLLQHGSVLIDGTQDLVRAFACRSPGPGERRSKKAAASTTLHEQLGRVPAWREVAETVIAGLSEVMGTAMAEEALPPAARRLLPSLERHYRSRDWTLRR